MKKMKRKVLSLLLVLCMTVCLIPTTRMIASAEEKTDSTDETAYSEDLQVSDYDTFLSDMKILEEYAASYAKSHTSENVNALVINYIRTGVERYLSTQWTTLAGAENTAFTAYVKEQDAANGTTASALKNIGNFEIPNGDVMDFGHVFGTLDITYYAIMQKMSDINCAAHADLGGWAGDIADMMFCAEYVDIEDKVDVTETNIETLAGAIRTKYLGVDYGTLNSVDHSFTNTDLYGDLDAFYISNELKAGAESISTLFENYFTSDLTNVQRADYFLNKRLYAAKKQGTIRERVLKVYRDNSLLSALEASYAVSDLSYHDTLQRACCYAFADYLFELAGDENAEDGELSGGDTGEEEEKNPENQYYSVFSNTRTTLAPGITQDKTLALTADNKQIAYYTATVDLSRDDVNIYANYKDNDGSNWGMSRVSDQMKAAQERHSNTEDPEHYIDNYNPIVGINADFFNMTNGEPSGALVMEGVEYHGSNSNFFAILKDGTAMVGDSSEYSTYKDQIQEAVGGSIWLVRDGKIAVTASSDYYNNRVPRSCVGVKKDGSVVLVALDGRQEPYSAGGSAEEIAQIMMDAGCVDAINLDGGGSTTFDAKQEGSDEISVVNRPSDGYERAVSSSIVVVSTAETSTEFDHALVQSDMDYLTENSSIQLEAAGVSKSGNAAEIPMNSVWSLSDDSLGSITEDGVFTAAANVVSSSETPAKEVTVNLSVDGNVVGSKTLTIVAADAEEIEISFTRNSIDVIYGNSFIIPVQVTYSGLPVMINPEDIVFIQEFEGAEGIIDGFVFMATADPDLIGYLRNSKLTATLALDYSRQAIISISYFSEGEAYFDFDTAMFGERSLAWNRKVSNSKEVIETPLDSEPIYTYYIQDANQDMVTDYTFALDMQNVEAPEELAPMFAMLGNDSLRPWDLLLAWAERISAKTTITAQINIDKNMDVDFSDVKIVNDLFSLTDVTLNEATNTLTLKLNWNKQSEALNNVDEDGTLNAALVNPIAIVSGIKLTPKDSASWDDANCLKVVNSGAISYDIYIGANFLYNDTWNQYGIYKYEEPENTSHPVGGHFSNEYVTFEDTYTLDKTIKQGWTYFNGALGYYEDNRLLTGIHKLPGYQDEVNQYYYNLGDEGVYSGKYTGFVYENGKYYYAINGETVTGWRNIDDEYYYFNTDGSAQTGITEFNIYGIKVTYDFEENGKLKTGVWLDVDYTSNGTHVIGTRYYYGPEYYVAKGFSKAVYFAEIDGHIYGFDRFGCTYKGVSICQESNNSMMLASFTDEGIYQGSYMGIGPVKASDGRLYYAKGGKPYFQGLYAEYYDTDGNQLNSVAGADVIYYYYFYDDYGAAYRNCDKNVKVTNNLLPIGTYHFDENGRYIVKVKNGIYDEDGTLYYYKDNQKISAGLVAFYYDKNGNQITDEHGAAKIVYYYIDSDYVGARNEDVTVSNTNDLLPEGTYHFDENGQYIVYPKYTVSLYYSLTDLNGEETRIYAATSAEKGVGTAIKLTAEDTYTDGINIYQFDHWEYDGMSMASNAITIRPDKGGGYDAYACYVITEQEKEKNPIIEIIGSYPETVNGVAKIASTLSYSVPEGYSVVGVGFVVSTKVSEPSVGAAGCAMSTSSLTSATGTYTVHVNVNTKRTTDVYVRAYVKYKKSDGQVDILYADTETCNWSVMSSDL